jgi:hypothetical protein
MRFFFKERETVLLKARRHADQDFGERSAILLVAG